MSWFKRRPRVKEPPKAPPPRNTSPLAEKILKESRKEIRKKSNE
jgi:hypothetical protein